MINTIEQVNELCITYAAKLLMDMPNECERFHMIETEDSMKRIEFIINFVESALADDEMLDFWEEETTNKLGGLVVMQMTQFIMIESMSTAYDRVFNHNEKRIVSLKKMMKEYALYFWNEYINNYISHRIDKNDKILNYFQENTYYLEEHLKFR
jgi:hypothetical protein